MKRREFIGRLSGTTVALSGTAWIETAYAADQVHGANDRLRIGWIGCGGRGHFVAGHILACPNTQIVAVCDVSEQQVARAKGLVGQECAGYKDFRRVLDRPDVDAVLVATPDHWHAIPTVLACQAGKDVYVEKPLAHTIFEGRAMVAAARKYQRIVQTGTQQRSAGHFDRIREIIQSGELGPVRYVRIWNFRNFYPDGIGHAADSAPPSGLDWDFFLGPAPYRPYNRLRHQRFRYFWDYSGGVPTDWGTHRFDVVQLIMDVDAPRSVSASGGKLALQDDGEVPDTLHVTYEYPGFVCSYEASLLNAFGCGTRSASIACYHANGPDDRPNGMAFYGTNGTLIADRLGFEIFPELRPGAKATAQDRDSLAHFRMKRQIAFTPDSTRLHVQNFLDCVRSRKTPVADIEHGQRATTTAHLANIAYRTGHKLHWNRETEQIVDDPKAASMLRLPGRKPWDLI